MEHIIREYTKEDIQGIKQCLMELQEFEKMLDPNRLAGIEVAHDYLEHLLQLSRQEKGKLFVVEINNEIVGMVSVVIENYKKHMIKTGKVAFISDVIILPEYKDKGIMKDLLGKAEEYARSKGIQYIQTALLNNHSEGIERFTRNGFHSYETILQKKLS
jgi:GNAT superfamily N-acetyltransferase